MLQKENIAAINAKSKVLLNIISRTVLIYYAIANSIGIIWYLSTISQLDMLRGSLFIISTLIIGLSPLKLFKDRLATIIYVIICLIGIISTLFLSLKLYFEEYGGLYDYLEQLIIIICFAFMMARKIVINKVNPYG